MLAELVCLMPKGAIKNIFEERPKAPTTSVVRYDPRNLPADKKYCIHVEVEEIEGSLTPKVIGRCPNPAAKDQANGYLCSLHQAALRPKPVHTQSKGINTFKGNYINGAHIAEHEAALIKAGVRHIIRLNVKGTSTISYLE